MIYTFAWLYALSTHTKTAMPMASILRALRWVTCSINKTKNSVVENKKKVNTNFLRSITQADWLVCHARQFSHFTDPAKVNRDQDWPTHTDRFTLCLPYMHCTLGHKHPYLSWIWNSAGQVQQIQLQTDPKTQNPHVHYELTSENTSTCSESQT